MFLHCTDSSQPRWFHVETHIRVLKLWFVLLVQLLLKLLLSVYNDRLVDHFNIYLFSSWTTKYVTFYAWTNRLPHCSTCNLPIQLHICVNTIINKYLTTSIIKYQVSGQWYRYIRDKSVLLPYCSHAYNCIYLYRV